MSRTKRATHREQRHRFRVVSQPGRACEEVVDLLAGHGQGRPRRPGRLPRAPSSLSNPQPLGKPRVRPQCP